MKTVNRVLELMFAICMGLFLCVGTAGAQEGLVWPVTTDLVARDWTRTDYQPWVKVGEVKFWHTRDALTIEIVPGTDPSGKLFKIKEVAIVTANEPDFSAVLDRFGKPAPALFPYKTDYLVDLGGPADRHTELIPVSTFQLCWGSAEKCPLDRYAIVHVELMMADAYGAYVTVIEPAFAGLANANSTVSAAELLVPFLDKKLIPIAWYVTYPFAQVETGHFVDAKVRGLTFLTPTQFGTSSDSGNFFYIPPEKVEFFVGSLYLGTALGDHTVSPIDLFEGSDLDDDRVLNAARVLQSLDSNTQPMLIDVTENVHCADSALAALGVTVVDFGVDSQVDALLGAMRDACPDLTLVSKDLARVSLDQGQQSANILKSNISKNAAMASDKAKIEIMPFYVPAQTADGTATTLVYYDAAGDVLETRDKAKPIVVTYEEEVEGTRARDIIVAISRDDGSTWKRSNLSKTAGRSSLLGYPGESNKPMLAVKDNKIFIAWTDKYCHGGRPAYAITRASDLNCQLDADPEFDGVLKETHEGISCVPDYPGDDLYWQDDIFGVGGPQRSVLYEDEWASMGEVPYSCVWTVRGKIEASGSIVWFKPERITSGRRDANQLMAAAADEQGVAIAWQEDPKGLRPPSEYGPGDGWSGATVSNKTDIWYSFIRWADFDTVDTAYFPVDNDHVDTDPDLSNRPKALVPFSLPVKITDNDMCSYENILGIGGAGEDAPQVEEQLGTHRYCGSVENIGTADNPGSNRLCAYTVPITNHDGVTHNVCVTAGDYATRRVLDGNTGASRPNLFLQQFAKPDGKKTAAVILAYEESKGLGLPPETDGHDEVDTTVEDEDDRYKPDLGKNVIYHSFPFDAPETVGGGFIINAPEGGYVVDEEGNVLLDPLGRPQLAYGNARRVRLLQQPKGKVGASKTILVALYREGADGHGKAADIFMRRMTVTPELADGNPYSFDHFAPSVQNVSSVRPSETRTYEVLDESTQNLTTVTKMVNWTWSDTNLTDTSEAEPYSNALAHRGSLTGDELIIAYSWVPNWGRQAPEKYDLYVRRSWDGGKTFRNGLSPITHTITYVDPVTKELTETIRNIEPGAPEPPRNVSNIRNNRVSVLEPRLVKTPGSILTNGAALYPEDVQNPSIYQVAWGLEVNELLNADGQPQGTPLDIYYGQTKDKGQNFETVIVTKGDGDGGPEEGWNLLAKDKPEQSGAQIKQTPDGSRMYAIWVENGEAGSDIMFRRIDYRK